MSKAHNHMIFRSLSNDQKKNFVISLIMEQILLCRLNRCTVVTQLHDGKLIRCNDGLSIFLNRFLNMVSPDKHPESPCCPALQRISKIDNLKLNLCKPLKSQTKHIWTHFKGFYLFFFFWKFVSFVCDNTFFVGSSIHIRETIKRSIGRFTVNHVSYIYLANGCLFTTNWTWIPPPIPVVLSVTKWDRILDNCNTGDKMLLYICWKCFA